MRFSPTAFAVAALSATAGAQAAMFADAYNSTGGNFKLQAIYDSSTSATNFTLTSPATNGDFGWVGIGTGQQMAGSNMVISWVINNAVVTSNRHAVAEAMPQTTGLTIAGIERNDALTKSDTATGTTVSWIQPGFPAAGSDMTAVNMIWSHNPVAPTSNDPTTTLYKHEIRGFITFDLTKPYDATGNVAASATSGGQATGNRMMNKYNMIVFAHMIFMIVGWLLIFPAGIFLARFGRTTFKWFPKHRIVQTFGVLIVFIGMFLGFGIIWTLGVPHFDERHEQLGIALVLLAIFQAVLGQVGHALWNGKGIRLINFLHIIIGVTILPLAVWNMGMGFDLWLWVPPKAASYVLYAWMGFLGLIYIIGLAIGLPKELKANKHDQARRAGVANGDSTDSVEKTHLRA